MEINLEDTLEKIDELRETEKTLYQSLINNANKITAGQQALYTTEEVEVITKQINSLSEARVTLYNTLSELNKAVIENDTIMKESIEQQAETLELLEGELNKSKQHLNDLQDNKLNHLKMIEITTYYSKHYDAQKQLMQIMTGIGIALLISVYLNLSLVTFIIIIIGIVWIGYRVTLMYMRTNTNYDEFNFMDPEKNPSTLSSSFSSSLSAPSLSCIGSACCSEGTTWSSTESQCIITED